MVPRKGLISKPYVFEKNNIFFYLSLFLPTNIPTDSIVYPSAQQATTRVSILRATTSVPPPSRSSTTADKGMRGIQSLQVAALVTEPPAMNFEIWHHPFHFAPKFCRVIRHFQMCEFMDDNIVDNLRGQLHDAPVEVQGSVGAARAPSVTEVQHLDVGSGLHSHD